MGRDHGLQIDHRAEGPLAIWARYDVPWQPAYVFYRPDGSSTFVSNPTSAMLQQDLADRVAALTG